MTNEQTNALRGLELAERNANDNPLTDDVAWLEHYRDAYGHDAHEPDNAPLTMEIIERQITQYHSCYIGNGMCAPYNRDVLRGWMRELGLTNNQINAFCDAHGIPHVV